MGIDTRRKYPKPKRRERRRFGKAHGVSFYYPLPSHSRLENPGNGISESGNVMPVEAYIVLRPNTSGVSSCRASFVIPARTVTPFCFAMPNGRLCKRWGVGLMHPSSCSGIRAPRSRMPSPWHRPGKVCVRWTFTRSNPGHAKYFGASFTKREPPKACDSAFCRQSRMRKSSTACAKLKRTSRRGIGETWCCSTRLR